MKTKTWLENLKVDKHFRKLYFLFYLSVQLYDRNNN